MPPNEDQLQQYESKRDLDQSPEPDDEQAHFDWADRRPVFVIHEHDASNLHYDLRLEVDGVLKCWAVPKGPSTDPRDRRLAVPTEDHPLSYADFEGVIPEHEYGGGTVVIWDRGSYRNLKEHEGGDGGSVAEQIEQGHVTVWLEGQKITGGHALIRTGGGDEPRWLLVKMDDDEADARRNPTSTEPESVETGRTLKEVGADDDRDQNDG